MEKRKQLLGLTRRHRKSDFSSSPIDSNGADDSEGGGGNMTMRCKKGKGRASRWRRSNAEANGDVGVVGSEVEEADAFLSPLITTSLSSPTSRKRVRIHGKVTEECDAVDPTPVPRKLRSAINKRTPPTLPNLKKRRPPPCGTTGTSFVNYGRKSKESLSWDSMTKEEEEVAEALYSLAYMAPLCQPTTSNMISADKSNVNVASTSFSEAALKEDVTKLALPCAANGVAGQSACTDVLPMERTGNVPEDDQGSIGTVQPCNTMDPPLPRDELLPEVSLGIAQSLPNSCGVSSAHYTGDVALEHSRLKLDGAPVYPPQKPGAPLRKLKSDGSEVVVRNEQTSKQTSKNETTNLFQASLPSASHGYMITSSSNNLAACSNTATGTVTSSSTGKHNKFPPANIGPMKTWKKSANHVYVSHMIQMYLDKEKIRSSSTPTNQANSEEQLLSCTSTAPNNYTLKERSIEEARTDKMHSDMRLSMATPVSGLCAAPNVQQRMGGNFLSSSSEHAAGSSTNGLMLPGQHHVSYLHPQVPHHSVVPFPFARVPYTQENVASPAIQQQVPQYMCSPCYSPRTSLTGGSTVMKLQQHLPQQQQQMWQLHVPQYGTMTGPSPTMWQNGPFHNLASVRSASLLPSTMPPNIKVCCGPYQSGSRQQQQLRLM